MAMTTAAAPAGARGRVAHLPGMGAQAVAGPGGTAAPARHAQGGPAARRRTGPLPDAGFFHEAGRLRRRRARGLGPQGGTPCTDGVVTGRGTAEGRTVFVRARGVGIFPGAPGGARATRIRRIMGLARAAGAPLLWPAGGARARIREGVRARAGCGGTGRRTTRACGGSPQIPQIPVMPGPCAGGAAPGPALAGSVCTVRRALRMFRTGPDAAGAVTGGETARSGPGGAYVHAQACGIAHAAGGFEAACVADVRRPLWPVPQNNRENVPRTDCAHAPDRRGGVPLDRVPARAGRPCATAGVSGERAGGGACLQVPGRRVRSILGAPARLGGRAAGTVAGRPRTPAPVPGAGAPEKAARCVRRCDAVSLPVVTLPNVPGVLAGAGPGRGGIVRHGVLPRSACCTATVPRIWLVWRTACGGAHLVLDSRSAGADLACARPAGQIAPAGARGAAHVIVRPHRPARTGPPAPARPHRPAGAGGPVRCGRAGPRRTGPGRCTRMTRPGAARPAT